MRNNRFNVRTTFGFGRNRGLLFAGAVAIGILFFMITIYNGSPVSPTKVQAAGREFRGGATPGMLDVALNFSDATRYAVFGGHSISNRGNSTFRGQVGSDGSVTGIEGYSANAIATGNSQQGLRDSINKINQLPCEQISETDLSGKSFSPGVYCLPSADLAGVMTVSGSGDSNSVFVFRVSGTMTTRDGSTIALADGAKATNVYFVAGGDVNVGSGNDINANLLSNRNVTIGDSSRVGGKTLSTDGDVVVTNSVLGAGTGSVEICKALTPGDPIAVGTIFTFNVTGLGTQVQVPAGACSAPMDVAVGNQTITEVPRANTAVVGIAANPANRLVSTNLPQGSAVVSVPEGGVTDQTIVTFTNQTTRTGTLEICKQGLDLDVTGFFNYTVQGAPGQTFSVPVGFCSGPITVTIPQVPNTAFTANVTELGRTNFIARAATTLPNGRLNSFQVNADNGATANITLISGGGVSQQTTVNFFNQSLPGIVKVCKITADPVNIPAGTLFHFTVTGTPGIGETSTVGVDVPAGPAPGFCQIVPGTWVVGTPVTVTETALGPGATLPGGLTFADTRVSAIVANPATPAATVNLDARSIITTARNTTVEVTSRTSYSVRQYSRSVRTQVLVLQTEHRSPLAFRLRIR